MIYGIDLDGTLLNSRLRHAIVLKEALKKTGNESCFSDQAFLEYKAEGFSTRDFCKNILKLDEVKTEQVARLWGNLIEEEQYLAFDTLYSDTIPFLERMRKQEVQMRLITARKEQNHVLEQLKNLGIYQYFSNIVVVNPRNAFQEKVEVIRELMQKDEVIVIGDTEVEYRISLELGIPVRILHRGFRSKNYWRRLGVDSKESLLEVCYEEE